MVWVRLDDTFPEHPKIIGLPAEAFRTHVCGICYCARNLTDGFVPGAAVNGAASELVVVGLWDRVESGYQIHDYLDFNPSKAKVLAERERRKKAGAKGGRNTAARKRLAVGAEVVTTVTPSGNVTPRPDPPPTEVGGGEDAWPEWAAPPGSNERKLMTSAQADNPTRFTRAVFYASNMDEFWTEFGK